MTWARRASPAPHAVLPDCIKECEALREGPRVSEDDSCTGHCAELERSRAATGPARGMRRTLAVSHQQTVLRRPH